MWAKWTAAHRPPIFTGLGEDEHPCGATLWRNKPAFFRWMQFDRSFDMNTLCRGSACKTFKHFIDSRVFVNNGTASYSWNCRGNTVPLFRAFLTNKQKHVPLEEGGTVLVPSSQFFSRCRFLHTASRVQCHGLPFPFHHITVTN